jgi:hypothetical protein
LGVDIKAATSSRSISSLIVVAKPHQSEASPPLPGAMLKLPSEDQEDRSSVTESNSASSGEHGREVQRSSISGASFNLLNNIVGAGIIGIPFAIQQCGLVIGVLCLTFVAFLIYQSVVMLIEVGMKEQVLDFEQLGMKLFGNRGYYIVLVAMLAFSLGGALSYLVILGDAMPLVFETMAPGSLLANRHFVLLLFSTVIILPIRYETVILCRSDSIRVVCVACASRYA